MKTWEKQFPEISDNWKKGFSYIYASFEDNKIIQFTFKVLHRMPTTRKELRIYNMGNDDLCTRCSSPDSIEHTFIICHESTSFWNLIHEWFNGMHNTKIDLSGNQLVRYIFMKNSLFFHFGTCPRTQTRNTSSVPVKNTYIYRCKVLEKNLNLNEFINKIFMQWKLENCGILSCRSYTPLVSEIESKHKAITNVLFCIIPLLSR